MKYFDDIRLFMVDQMKNYRVIDNDEIVIKALVDESNEDSGFFKGIFTKVEKFLASATDK